MKNPYLTTEACVERLYREWQKHPRLIVATDHDGTCWDFKNEGHEFSDTLDTLRRCQEHEFLIVVFTASEPERWPAIRKFYDDLGIKVTGINENPTVLPYGKWGKIYYNILLDDRAHLAGALEILNKVIDKIEKKNFYSEAERK